MLYFCILVDLFSVCNWNKCTVNPPQGQSSIARLNSPFPPSQLIQSLLTHVFPSIHFSFLLTDFSARTIRPRRFTETGCDLVEPLSHAETFSSVFKVLLLHFYKRLIPVEDVAVTVMAFCPPRTSSGHTCKGHMFL